MSPRGGKREGSGRPSKNRPTTKATVYIEDRELLNAYSQELGMSVNDLIHEILNNPQFNELLKSIENNNK